MATRYVVTLALTASFGLLANLVGAQTVPVAEDGGHTVGQDLGEIVVTANKREQSLNDVGQTVTAFGTEFLKEQRVENVADLALVTPGLVYTPTQNATPVYTIRGVGYNDPSLAAYPDVSLYIDQTPLSLPIMASLTMFDLERVEVLKGPQGTLFGNNATGGAINFVAAKPTKDFQAGVDLSYGRFNTIETAGFASGSLTDTLTARFAFKSANGDGWQYSYTRTDTIGKVDNIAARLLLDWTPTDRFTATLNINGWQDQDDPQVPQDIKSTPENPVGTVGLAGKLLPNYPILTYPLAPGNDRATDWDPTYRPFADNRFWQISLRADYKATDDLTLTSITGYNQVDFLNSTSQSGTDLPDIVLDPDQGTIHSFTQELRLANNAASRVRWVVGGNFEDTSVSELITNYEVAGTAGVLDGFGGDQFGSDQQMKNYAVFANTEFDVVDKVTLKAGVRETEADRHYQSFGLFETPDLFPPAGFGLNSLTKFFNTLYGLLYPGKVAPITPGQSVVLDTRTNPDGSPVDPSTYLKTGQPQGTLDERNTSWSVGLDYKPLPGMLVYGNVAKGYKAGSCPTIAGAIYANFGCVHQESVLDYEVGFKGETSDHRLSVNAATFYYDYDNKQVTGELVDPVFGELNTLINVPKSSVKGAEIGINGRLINRLTVTASGTYLDAKIKTYNGLVGETRNPATGLLEGVFQSFQGVVLPFSPTWQYSLGVNDTFPLFGRFSGYVGVTLTGQSSSIGVLTNSLQSEADYKIDSRLLTNLDAGITTADEKWRIGVWGKNVFNKYYWTYTEFDFDNLSRYAGRPADFGVALSYRF
jgi:iron complex outermembrane recepter protein